MRHLVALFVLGSIFSFPCRAGQPSLLQQADSVLYEGWVKASKATTFETRVSALREGLQQARPLLKARPELELVIREELAAPSTDKEVTRLLDIVKFVRHGITSTKHPADFASLPSGTAMEQVRKAVTDFGKLDVVRKNGKLKQYTAAYERRVAKEVYCFGTGTVYIAELLNSLGLRYLELGDYARSLAMHQRATSTLR